MIVTAVVGSTVVLYWQARTVRAARAPHDMAALWRALIQGSLWGTGILVPLFLVFHLMVAKAAF